jgi:DNA-binding protein HU-beta
MNKAEFLNKLYSSRFSTKGQAAEMLDAVLNTLTNALAAGESVTFTGFGTFSVTQRAARQGRNPRTGAPVNIAARKAVKFKPGKSLKEAVK